MIWKHDSEDLTDKRAKSNFTDKASLLGSACHTYSIIRVPMIFFPVIFKHNILFNCINFIDY